MARAEREWADFGWQGIYLRVPEDWNLGRVSGDYKSGYARLDDAEIVRAEIEWREGKGQAKGRLRISEIVDRYVESLEKKARKEGTTFSVQRRAKFLKDKTWLEGSDYETFTWDADFRAYNLARACGNCGRIVLLRILCKHQESMEDVVGAVLRSLQDHPHDKHLFWSIYGLNFFTPVDFKLNGQELKSGHIQLSFERGKQVCRIQRLSMASMLLKHITLEDWYPTFFKKQLRDFKFEVCAEDVASHEGLRVVGRPRSRWRQLLRPLPLFNPRPRQYLDSRVWHCRQANKICIVDLLCRKKDRTGGLVQKVINGYICHQKKTEAEPRSHAGFAAGPQRGAQLGS